MSAKTLYDVANQAAAKWLKDHEHYPEDPAGTYQGDLDSLITMIMSVVQHDREAQDELARLNYNDKTIWGDE